ncbi:MAG: dihydrofolate reductase [Alphaproteobacteria bacterium]|nr:dihydrofolate reductase [Alphaproteobacteria bacterium]
MSTLFRLYIAATVDGFIASRDGGVDWLAPYEGEDFGYQAFIAAIGTIVMGRASYDHVRAQGVWPYEGKRVVVLTSRPLGEVPDGVKAWNGHILPLADHLRAENRGDVWLMGGGRAIRPFLESNLVDRIELFLVPLLLGDGIPLFERSAQTTPLQLRRTVSHGCGVVQLVYGRGDLPGEPHFVV